MSVISVFRGLCAFFIFQFISGAVLDQYIGDSSSCESHCDEKFSEVLTSSGLIKSCGEGCRLFKLIGFVKGFSNQTIELCISACSEAFENESLSGSCNYGCQQMDNFKPKDDSQTLHVLTPILYVKSAYNDLAHHVRQFISSSFTVYVQEDSGSAVVIHSKPKMDKMEDVRVRQQEIERKNYLKNFKPPWEAEKLDWMDCLSHQSGIPRWLLAVVLFGFIIALMWLCCATAVTAPNHYLTSPTSSPKLDPKNNVLVLVRDLNQDYKTTVPLVNVDEDAPLLPPKFSLI